MCYNLLVMDIWEEKREELNVWVIDWLLELIWQMNLKGGR